MAARAEGERLKGLICPLCLDIFNKATILNCGHTFCKRCLEAYDEQHNESDCIVCPVCRKNTKLGQHRVAGLIPNFLVKGLYDELFTKEDNRSSTVCSLHCGVFRDIFCELCEDFICLTCFFDNHQGHRIKKKEQLEDDLDRKREAVIAQSVERKAKIVESIINAEQEQMDVYCHLKNVETEVTNAFARKVTTLKVNEEKLLEKVNRIRQYSDNRFQSFIANQRESVDNIESSITKLTSNIHKYLDSDTLKAYHLKYNDLERSLQKAIKEEQTVWLKQEAKLVQFCPAGENLLAIGHIAPGKEAAAVVHREILGDAANNKVEKAKIQGEGVEIPSTAKTNYLTIVRKVDLPHAMWGMAAFSKDAVAVGYGDERPGTDCFHVSGDRSGGKSGDMKPHLKQEVGRVYDIAFLTNGRPVLSHGMDTFSVYNILGTQSTGEKRCNQGKEYIFLCSDRHEKIYAVNGNPEIYIFHGTKTNTPLKVISTGSMEPEQIGVTANGLMIIGACSEEAPNTVRVYDKKGRVGSSIAARNAEELLCPAVDSQDRVLVARVGDGFRLTRYTLEGARLVEQVTFQTLHLPQRIDDLRCWCYMVSLRPNLIAFATGIHLYFIELTS